MPRGAVGCQDVLLLTELDLMDVLDVDVAAARAVVAAVSAAVAPPARTVRTPHHSTNQRSAHALMCGLLPRPRAGPHPVS
jgi:hypothetical protein